MSDTGTETVTGTTTAPVDTPAVVPVVAPSVKAGAEPIGGLAPETQQVQPLSPKPDSLPDKFWNTEHNAVNLDLLTNSYTELEKQFTTKTEALKTQIESQFHEQRLAQRPESPNDYNPQPPEGFLPKGATFHPVENDPMLEFWRNTAHDLGLSQTEFEKGIASYVDHLVAQTPDPEVLATSLGENGKDRINSIEAWLSGKLGQDSLTQFSSLLTQKEGINNLEKMIGMTKDFQQGGTTLGTKTNAPLDQAAIEAKMKDPRYADPFKREPAFVEEVMSDWKRLKPDPEEVIKNR